MPEILEDAGSEYDLIVVDSPPILGFPEPLQMAAAVDGVVMVAKAGETNRKTVGSALEHPAAGARQRGRSGVELSD